MYTQLTQNHDEKLSTVLAFDVEYSSVTGKQYRDTLIVDLSEYKGTHQVGKPHLYAIAQSLEKIQKDIDRLIGGSKRVKTDVYTDEDRTRERVQRDEWIAEQRGKTDA